MNIVGENLKAIRKKKGISQEELAGRLNVTRQTVSNWERGAAYPDIDMLKMIAEQLEVEVTRIIYSDSERGRVTSIASVGCLPVLLTPVVFFALMFFGIIVYLPMFKGTFGGGIPEEYLYPIYFGVIMLATLMVACTSIVLEEIREQKRKDDGER